jgi:hypothetical protein
MGNIGNQPPFIAALPIEFLQLEIPVVNLEKVERDLLNRLKNKVPFLHFIEKKCFEIGLVVVVKIIFYGIRFFENLDKVHKIQLVAHGVQELFHSSRVGIKQLCERIEVCVVDHPLYALIFLFKFQEKHHCT